jgi:hypothetical protein
MKNDQPEKPKIPLLNDIKITFTCNYCDYITSNKKDFNRHLKTQKHLKKVDNSSTEKSPTNILKHICENCNKIYKEKTGLWRHKKTCIINSENSIKIPNINQNEENNDSGFLSTDMVMELIKQNKEIQNILIEQNKEYQKQIIEIAQKQNITTTNSNNTTNNNQFNLNFFLNETCKDALNITDFINSLQLTVKDFETTGRLGYVEGISRIILNGIKDMDVSKRPVHCTDLKRETVYIKHENEWEKENTDKKKLKWAVSRVAQMNLNQLPNWQLENPDCVNIDTRQNEELLQYSLAALGGQYKDEEDKFMDKIMKNVLKEVVIDKK